MTRDSQSWAGPRKSHLNNLGVGGRGQMKRTEKGKQNPDERTAHINLLVPQSQKQGHGSCCPLQSVGGRRAQRGRGGHRDSTGEGAGKSPWRRGGPLTRKQSHHRPLLAASGQDCLLQVCSLQGGRGGVHLPSPHPLASPAWF